MKFYAVIGANYGDEGKGLVTDWLCRTVKPTRVVRFNGGAQAGHTVCTEAGERHVFSTYGSGTLAGVPTEITRDVVLNPYAASMEFDELDKLMDRRPPRVFHTSLSPITTQFEVAINQAVEKQRGDSRHGSCGLGINETVERHLAMKAEAPELLQMLYYPNSVGHAFSWIRMEWLPRRMKQLGFDPLITEMLQVRSTLYEEPFIDCLREAHRVCWSLDSPDPNHTLVYEGAQGLALDEELGTFPYVTRSNTGIRNVLHDIKRRLDALNAHDEYHTLFVFYPTRTYLTRHGRGPLPYEDEAVNILCGNTHIDETNFTNPWQEHLRYAPLHVADTCSRIKQDQERNEAFLKLELPRLNVQPRIVLTCCDQASLVRVVDNDMGKMPWTHIARMFEVAGLPVAATSHGPTASTMQILDRYFKYGFVGGAATETT
jgi:adenylosuccinate synthase